MSIFLKQSTAVVVPFGPFVSPSDGVTLVTSLVSALDHASTGIFLIKNGGSGAIRHATVTATTYDAYGMYLVTLDTTDTATLGRVRMYFAAAASCLPVWRDFHVLPANIYDSLVAGSDVLDVSVTQWLGTAAATPGTAGVPSVDVIRWSTAAVATVDTAGYPKVTVKSGTGTGEISLASGIASVNMTQIAGTAGGATKLDRSTRAIATATVGSSSSTTSIVTSAISPAATATDQFKGRIVTFDDSTTTAALRGQATDITASTSGGVLTVTALTTAPASGDTFTIT